MDAADGVGELRGGAVFEEVAAARRRLEHGGGSRGRAKVVRMMMRALEAVSLRAAAHSRPVISGISMSVTTTSGGEGEG